MLDPNQKEFHRACQMKRYSALLMDLDAAGFCRIFVASILYDVNGFPGVAETSRSWDWVFYICFLKVNISFHLLKECWRMIVGLLGLGDDKCWMSGLLCLCSACLPFICMVTLCWASDGLLETSDRLCRSPSVLFANRSCERPSVSCHSLLFALIVSVLVVVDWVVCWVE